MKRTILIQSSPLPNRETEDPRYDPPSPIGSKTGNCISSQISLPYAQVLGSLDENEHILGRRRSVDF